MGSVVNGNNVVLYYYNSASYEDIPFACATTANLSIQTELLEVTNQSSAFFRDFKANMTTWGITGGGFTILNDQWNYFHIADLIKNRTEFLVKFVIDNGDALGLTIFSGTVIVTSYELTGGFDQLSTYAFQLQGCGEFSTSGTVVTPSGSIIISGTTLQVFQVTASADQTVITFPGTIGLDAIYASRGGQTIQPLAYTGSPEGNGGVWNTLTGQLTVLVPAADTEQFLILAQ